MVAVRLMSYGIMFFISKNSNTKHVFLFSILALIFFIFGSSSYDTFGSNQTTPLDGMNFSKSQDIYSKDGILKSTISASYHVGKVDNQSVTSMLYNGSLGGPILHVYPGDKIELDLINNLNESTNLHFHGLHVSPLNNSDNVFLEIAPGKTQHYSVDIPKDHSPAMFWYHSHIHHISTEQVASGLSGLIIIEGLELLLPEPLQNITAQNFALRDFIDSNTGMSSYRTINGETHAIINNTADETQLWRFANIGSEPFYELRLPGYKFYVIAEDGSPVWKVWNNDTLLLPSGKRFEVLVTTTENGSTPLIASAYYPLPETTIATVNSKDNNQKVSVNANLTSLVLKDDFKLKNITNYRVLNFTSDDNEFVYKINNKTFDANRIDQKMKLGDIEQWKLINYDNDDHPFHIHVNDFEVISVNDKPYNAQGLQDTVIIPKHGEVVIQIAFEDFVGKSVYHCHIMFHGDNGMMGTFEVVK
jgi:FtsP/CotA-like multicopper oxidase with cupredoxin domain